MNGEHEEWTALFASIADVVLLHRDDRTPLIEGLGDALEACAMQFPFIEPGEDLYDICPFTFFASIGREIPDRRRQRFLDVLNEVLFSAKMPFDEYAYSQRAPAGYRGLHEIATDSVRFFGTRSDDNSTEIEAHWHLFACALRYADERTTESESSFIEAFDRLTAFRNRRRVLIPTALSWIRPRFFLPTDCCAEFRSSGSSDTQKDGRPMSGADYVAILRTAHKQVKASESAYCENTSESSIFPLTFVHWEKTRTPEPSPNTFATSDLIDAYMKAMVTRRARTQAKWSAVRTFEKHWDPDAVDFSEMLARALEGYEDLVPPNPAFDPRKDILVFAEKEPATVREAFSILFDTSRPPIERVLRFEAATATLFEKYRGDIIRAIPRRSSHGNFFAISAYLFLRYPDSMHLFSPRRLKALNTATGYGCDYRIADPHSIEQYFALCEKVVSVISENEQLLELNDSLHRPQLDYPDTAHHLLVDDIADFASEWMRTEHGSDVL